MDARSILSAKRDGAELSQAQIEAFVRGYVAGEIPDYFASALMMAIYVHGMTPAETGHLTRAMLESGERWRFALGRPTADKHSTGGIGDKVSIPLAPAVAACGVAVPMISGRGLGHTGGTLDKLESIPGFRTQLSQAEFRLCLERTGVALGGQTAQLVPADRKLYALRDVTGLIESIPLIASSIMSKKLAEGIDALVLDVKFGSGAFMVDPARGAELARAMLVIARKFGLKATAFQTCMDRPLGRAAGHALEIKESLDCLEGQGPADLRELVCLQGGEMLRLAGAAADIEAGRKRIERALDDGSALAVFEKVVGEQGGDARCLRKRELLPAAPDLDRWKSTANGTLSYTDLRELGLAICELGGGRRLLGDTIDPAVGLVFLRAAGERIEASEPLIEIHHRGGRGLAQARERIGRALRVGEAGPPSPLVLARVES